MELNTKSGLQGLSKEVFDKAIKKVKPATPYEEWELKLLTEDLLDAAIWFMKDFFVPYEPLVQAFGVQWDEDAESYWRDVFNQGMTLVLVNKTDGTIIAIRGLEVVNKSNKICTENISDEKLRHLLDYINYCDGHAKFFEHYGCEEAIHFSGLAVHEAYRRKGIATFMLKSAVNFVNYLGLESVCIKGEASSEYSKRIYDKLNFDFLFEQSYQDYRVNGMQIMHDIGEHKSNKIYGKHVRLEQK